MQFYLSIDGRKEGPFSTFEVDEFLDTRRVTPDSLGWHRDLDGWKPLREIDALEGVVIGREADPEGPDEPEDERDGEEDDPAGDATPPLPDPSGRDAPRAARPQKVTRENPTGHETEIRPFVRFWARMFDYTLVFVVVFLVSDVNVAPPEPDDTVADVFSQLREMEQSPEMRALAWTHFFALVGWHLVEGVLIHLFGTTPGKALLGIRVAANDGSRLPMLRSLGRSFYVYALGTGFYIALLMLIAMAFSFFRLMTTGKCLWDQQLEIRVENPSPGVLRVGLAVGAFMTLFLLQWVIVT